MPASRRVLVGALAAAVVIDAVTWTDGPGLAWALAVAATALVLGVTVRPLPRPAAFLLLLAPVMAAGAAWRSSPTLVTFDVLTALGCLFGGAGLARGGRWTDQSMARLALRVLQLVEDALLGPLWVTERPDRRRQRRLRAAHLGGLVLAGPLVVVVVMLLASADPVFSSLVTDGIEAGDLAHHLAAVAAGLVAVVALARHTAATTDVVPTTAPRLPATTADVVMGSLAVVLGAYAAARLAALSGAADHILRTEGLTWADYARSGFFQLLAVAAIVAVVVTAACGFAPPIDPAAGRRRRIVGLVLVAEVLAVVIDAIGRLLGYADAYGWTVLRLDSTVFAVWLGVAVALVGVAVATGYSGRRWLTTAMLAVGAAAVATITVIGPEGIVVRDQVGRTQAMDPDTAVAAETVARFDAIAFATLVTDLGDDGLAALDERWDDLAPARQDQLQRELCTEERDRGRSWNPNVSRRRADQAVTRWCSTP